VSGATIWDIQVRPVHVESILLPWQPGSETHLTDGNAPKHNNTMYYSRQHTKGASIANSTLPYHSVITDNA